MNRKLLIILIFFYYTTFGQTSFPQGYFIMPISPGQATSLSGCFGDIRINHFHAGLDIRTGGVEGKNVYAAADGYVSRIKVMNGGYGNSVYLTHPNGLTTVYAHLKVLNDTLQHFLVSKQYEQKTWEIDIFLDSTLFKFKQREILALSGNTGGSAGPHLHFEIRDQQENILDPSQFGFSDLTDNIKPIIESISLKCMSADATINGNFGIFNFPVIKGKDGLYTITEKIEAKGEIGLEILTYDKANNSPFRQGVNQINLNVNQKNVYNFRLDKMSFSNRLDMNVHVNYEKLIKKGQKIHKCYIEDGNTFDFYKTNSRKGKFSIENETNLVEIRVNDSFANASVLKFNIIKDTLTIRKTSFYTKGFDIKSRLQDQFLKIEINDPENKVNNLICTNGKTENVVSLSNDSLFTKTFIFDLNKTLAETIFINKDMLSLPFNVALSPEKSFINLPGLEADFKDALFRPYFVHFSVTENILNLHEDVIPLKNPATIVWKKTNSIVYPNKLKVYLMGSKPKFIGGEWSGSNITFKTKEFGTFQTLFDFEQPIITPKTISKDYLSFRIKDELSGIKSINCKVNQEWVLMNFEYKSGLIWSEKLDNTKPFRGNLVLEITDNCENIKRFEILIPPSI